MDVSGIGQVQSIQAALHAAVPAVPGQPPVAEPLINPVVPEVARIRGTEKLRERQRGESPSSLKSELDSGWTPDVSAPPRHAGEDGQRPDDRPRHIDILA